MTELKIQEMHLENFKGVKDLTVSFHDGLTEITGRNGSGKTTIADAFCWVLFGTDSTGNAAGSDKFREKPLDDAGQEVHYLDTVVELACTLNGLPFHVKRLQRENWTKKRGFVDEVYSGNESTYWINGIETKLTDYKARIAEIAPASVIVNLARLGAFNEGKWQDRRAALLALCDPEIDSKMLADAKYAEIAKAVKESDVDVEGQRKLVKDRIASLKKELTACPIRIDEATKALPDVNDQKLKDAQYMIADAEKDIENIDRYIAEAKAELSGSTSRAKVSALESERDSIKAQAASALAIKRAEASAKVEALQTELGRLEAYKRDVTVNKARIQTDINTYTKRREDLLTEFAIADGKVTTVEGTCPTCGQEIPAGVVEEMEKKLREAKAALKADIRQRGTECRRLLDEANDRMAKVSTEIAALESDIEAKRTERDEAMKKLSAIPVVPDFSKDKRLSEIADEIDRLSAGDVTETETKIAGYERRRAELQERITKARAVEVQYASADDTRKRIEDLKADQKRFGKELAAAERLQDLLEQYVRDRCDRLTDSINALFPTVRWKLFATQINGGISDVCTCMIPCESGLIAYESANTAARINADVEIVRVLSDNYWVKIPLFVDGAERVNKLAETGTQTITLSVSDGDLTIN